MVIYQEINTISSYLTISIHQGPDLAYWMFLCGLWAKNEMGGRWQEESRMDQQINNILWYLKKYTKFTIQSL